MKKLIREDTELSMYIDAKRRDEDFGTAVFAMARVGFLGDGKKYKVIVWPEEGDNIPHMHIMDTNEEGLLDACIRIDEAEYFPHGKHTDILNRKQKDMFITLMEGTKLARGGVVVTNWQRALDLWNENTNHVQLPEDMDMPDYRKL